MNIEPSKLIEGMSRVGNLTQISIEAVQTAEVALIVQAVVEKLKYTPPRS